MGIDMPIEQLQNYQGQNPKPADWEKYWERALHELDQTDPQPELIKSDFKVPNAECFDLYFNGVKSCRIHAKLIKPSNIEKKVPAMLMFHGYSDSAGEWNQKLNYTSIGFVVAAMDVRGQGGLSEDLNPVRGTTLNGHIVRGIDDPDPDNLFFRQVFLDTAQLARVLMSFDFVDENRLAVKGGSQGGALTLACAALVPQIKKIAVWYPFLSDFKRSYEMGHAPAEIPTYFRKCNPDHSREEEVFQKLGYIDVQFLAPKIKAEVLFFTGLTDVTCPPSTQAAVYNKLTCKKKQLFYPDFGHEDLTGSNDIAMQFFLDL